MVRWPEAPELRRCALAVAVLHDLDVLPAIDGIVLPGSPMVEVSWTECRRALGGVEPESDDGRYRLAPRLPARRSPGDAPPAAGWPPARSPPSRSAPGPTAQPSSRRCARASTGYAAACTATHSTSA